MERTKFLEAFHKASCQLDKKKLRKITRRSIDSIHGNEEKKRGGITISLLLWKNWPNCLNKRAKQ